MSVGAQTKISIDAPGQSNVPLAILVMFIGGMVNLAQIRLVLGRVFQRLTAQALTDPLTGTVNRRGPMSQIEELHLRAAHGGDGYVVLMLDLGEMPSLQHLVTAAQAPSRACGRSPSAGGLRATLREHRPLSPTSPQRAGSRRLSSEQAPYP